MKIGLQIPYFSWPGSPENHRQVLRDAARTAEDAGFSSLWVMDHYFQLPNIGEAELDMHEAYTTLGYLAGVTERITLGALVTGVTYRHPGLLVKEATTLDVLSGGRAWLSLGAAWYDREHIALGVPFPPLAERFERLEEALQIAHQMWSDNNGPHHGKHYTLEETLCSPKPLQKPRPPILVGGGGEKKTLRLVAKYADASNIFGEANEFEHKMEVLRRHCDAEGRDYDAIEKTAMVIALPGVDVAQETKARAEAGAEHVIFTAVPAQMTDMIKDVARAVL